MVNESYPSPSTPGSWVLVAELLRERTSLSPSAAQHAAQELLFAWSVGELRSFFDTRFDFPLQEDESNNSDRRNYRHFPLGRQRFHHQAARDTPLTLWVPLIVVAAALYFVSIIFLFFKSVYRLVTRFSFLAFMKAWEPLIKAVAIVRDSYRYVQQPGYHEILRAAVEGKALCVNSQGKFEARKADYVVVSHVWGETMGWWDCLDKNEDESESGNISKYEESRELDTYIRKNGLHFRHLQEIFARCGGAEWIWLDILAFPSLVLNEVDNLSNSSSKVTIKSNRKKKIKEMEQARMLRAQTLNNLRKIYMGADKVIVLDNLLLHFTSEESLVYAGMALALGQWMRRAWTLVEVRLARRVEVATRRGKVDLDEVIAALEKEESLFAITREKLGPALRFLRAARHTTVINTTTITTANTTNTTTAAAICSSSGSSSCVNTSESGKKMLYSLDSGREEQFAEIVNALSLRSADDAFSEVAPLFPLLDLSWDPSWEQKQTDAKDAVAFLLQMFPAGFMGLAGIFRKHSLPRPYSWVPAHLNGLYGRKVDGMEAVEGETTTLAGQWRTINVTSAVAARGITVVPDSAGFSVIELCCSNGPGEVRTMCLCAETNLNAIQATLLTEAKNLFAITNVKGDFSPGNDILVVVSENARYVNTREGFVLCYARIVSVGDVLLSGNIAKWFLG